MHAYEIRIFRNNQIAAIITASLLGDHAAVRRAHRLARDGDQVEVWRGQACICAGSSARALAH